MKECPRCRAQIADDADPCPECGLSFRMMYGSARTKLRTPSQPASAFVFDTLGIITWIVAAAMFYAEETMSTSVPSDNTIGGIANLQLMHVQTDLLIAAGIASIVGTLFVGFSAVAKQVYLLRLTFPGN